jgi:uncharacterized protein (DUF2336 family)
MARRHTAGGRTGIRPDKDGNHDEAARRMAGFLAKSDVERLLADPSASARADMVAALAKEFETGTLRAAERRLAEDIFRALARDAAERVRRALSEHLKDSRDLPHDVALALARDIDAVALPVLQHSLVLSDADLIEIVRRGGPGKQVAIAGRASVAAPVAEAIVEASNAAAVARLVGNDGAALGADLLNRVVERYPDDAAIQMPLAGRKALPAVVVERLLALASDSLRQTLVERHDLPSGVASDLILQIRERATAGLLSAGVPEGDAERLARQLAANGRLTASLILRTLCLGDLAFLEAAFAELANVPIDNARLLIHDPGGLGLKSLYAHTGLAKELYPAFRVALDVACETPFDGGENDRERHRRRSLERILTQFEGIGAEDLDYLLAKLQENAAAA